MRDRDRRWAAVYAHRERLLRLARARLDDPEDAEDCVQEAMLRCVEFPGLDEQRLGQFLTTVTIRLCADVHRGRARGERLSRRLTGFWGAEPGHEESVCDRAESAWLSRRLDTLTPNQRAIVEARAEGLSCGAVAERLLVPYTTVESALARVRRSLRGALESTLGVAAVPLSLRRLAAGGAVATAAALTVAGPAELPERGVPPVAAPPAAPVVRPAAPRATAPPPALAASRARQAARVVRAAAASPARGDGPARRPARRTGDRGGVWLGGRKAAGHGVNPHGYTVAERVEHCVRYGVSLRERFECRYPPERSGGDE